MGTPRCRTRDSSPCLRRADGRTRYRTWPRIIRQTRSDAESLQEILDHPLHLRAVAPARKVRSAVDPVQPRARDRRGQTPGQDRRGEMVLGARDDLDRATDPRAAAE